MEKEFNSWRYSLGVLKALGLYSTNRKKVTFFAAIYFTLLMFIECLVLMQFKGTQGDIFKLVNNGEAFGVFAHMFAKIMVAAYQQKKLIMLLEDTKQFWKTSVCTDSIKDRLDKFSKNIEHTQQIFFVLIMASVSFLMIYGLMEKRLPLGIWSMDGYDVLYNITLTSHLIMWAVGGFAVWAFDCLYLTFCTETIVQFKILCYCLTELNVSVIVSENDQKEYYNQLRLYIEHHIFLLRFLKGFQNLYSPALFSEYVTISPLLCAELYVLLESNTFSLIAWHSIIFSSQVLQLMFYCISADYVISEALTVSEAVYHSDWNSQYFPTLRKPLTFIMQRSQQEMTFTAGGLFEINARTVLAILRVSWSACTVIRGLKGK